MIKKVDHLERFWCGEKHFQIFFFGYAGSGSGQSGSGQIQNIESLKRLYSVCWGGNKWPRRPLGGG